MAKRDERPALEVVTGEVVEQGTQLITPRGPRDEQLGRSAAQADYSGATSDAGFIALWLDGRRTSPHTIRSYTRAAGRFLTFLSGRGLTLRAAKVADLLAWQSTLIALDEQRRPTPAGERYVMSAHTRQQLAAVKSLLAKGHSTGYLPFDVGAAVELPSVRDNLAERILSIEEVEAVFATATPDEEPVVKLLYYLGCRVSELAQLQWKHISWQPDDASTVTIHGKREKTRHVHLEPEQTKLLGGLRPPGRLEEIAEKYVFATRNGKHIHTSGLWRVVHAAVVRAAIEHSKASPHWFRHAHASHALDAGAPPHLVQQTLGHASLTTTTRYAHVRPGESSSRYLKRK